MKEAIVRGLRTLIQVMAGAGVNHLLQTPYGILVAPVVAGLGKYLRAKDPIKWAWLPF